MVSEEEMSTVMNIRDNNTLYDTPHLLLFQAALLGIGYGLDRAVKGRFSSFFSCFTYVLVYSLC